MHSSVSRIGGAYNFGWRGANAAWIERESRITQPGERQIQSRRKGEQVIEDRKRPHGVTWWSADYDSALLRQEV